MCFSTLRQHYPCGTRVIVRHSNIFILTSVVALRSLRTNIISLKAVGLEYFYIKQLPEKELCFYSSSGSFVLYLHKQEFVRHIPIQI